MVENGEKRVCDCSNVNYGVYSAISFKTVHIFKESHIYINIIYKIQCIYFFGYSQKEIFTFHQITYRSMELKLVIDKWNFINW